MATRRTISVADVLPPAEYERVRKEWRARMLDLKRNRRVAVGPFATVLFENWETMRYQIHEMLRIERGGEEQIADEIKAYAPLIPNGRELVATMMFEIDDPDRRARMLATLGGVERTVYLKIGESKVAGVLESEVERTNEDGKASAIHFFRFPLTPDRAAVVKSGSAEIVLGIGHANYAHMAMLTESVRSALADDLD
ncbi:MAG: DUF3501 family protein [Alphaproteobacteria bacterium]|nr:DUF3501 family protein [Alphaproteobacteria bacterium]